MKAIAIFFFSLLSLKLFSQIPLTSISGTVKDAQNKSLPGTTVRLLNASDSTLVRGTVTDINGKFEFNTLSNGSYQLLVTAINQRSYQSNILTIDDAHSAVVLPLIVMTPSKDIELKEVVVKAKRPLIEHEIDKMLVNVESMIGSSASNTLEVLEKTPGVVVNANGDISLNGRSGVLVLIEGRATYMSGQDLAAYLKSLPGGLLDKIELIDNPSSKYDAAGNAVINIRLKKNREGGVVGNLALGYSQGVYGRQNGSLNLNYNHKKFNLFGNMGVNNEKNYVDDIYERRFYDTDDTQTSIVALVNQQKLQGQGISLFMGVDYAATAKTTYGMMLNLNNRNGKGELGYASRNYNAQKQVDALSRGMTDLSDKRRNNGLNFNFQHKFDNANRELIADVNYLRYESDGSQRLHTFSSQPEQKWENEAEFWYLVPGKIDIYTAKADYIHPLKNKSVWELGVKSSIVRNDNRANYYDIIANAAQIDNRKSNHYKYHENINGAYLNFRQERRRVGVQLGLRAENTQAQGYQLGNEVIESSTFSKSYTRLFPSVFINYKLDSLNKNSFNLSFTRRINRPNYQQMNPFVFFQDAYSYTAGNPFLNPQYQNRIELKFQHKQWLQLGLSYNHFTDIILQTTEVVDTIFIARPNNIAKGFMLILNTTFSGAPTGWWNLIYTLRLSHLGLNGTSYTETLTPRAYVARFEMYNQFRFKNNWSADLSGYYASSDLSGQTYSRMMYRVGVALQKKIWKNKGSIRLSADDIFHSWIRHSYSVGVKQAEFFQTNQSDTQRVGVAFTYRFGKDGFRPKRHHQDNAADDEKGRIN
ncbi:outer membrane beta-barrel protein [Runella sp. MFBS21]|uniref:outer membrane beta-barrel protein n=1 Tax=Runella sp. MFBS21 TaxID=3034018 RepID=UPI0023F7EBAA|nr:outer membrane beta-barrel protein [Runella sp. MFBS21]MDF7820890.1 outer membrane beta-barrel protein [Runella sp. MFBS21]